MNNRYTDWFLGSYLCRGILRDRVRLNAHGKMSSQVWFYDMERIWDPIMDQVCVQVMEQVWDHVMECTNTYQAKYY
jgi:hypothetical protein